MAKLPRIPAPLHDGPANEALAIFKQLRIPDLPGKPTLGDTCRPWVFDFVRALFGGFNPDTGQSDIREAFLLIPKKNGKTIIGAAVLLTQAILLDRDNDELLLLSATKEVANLAFSTIAGMVRADEDLTELFWVRDNIKTITDRERKNSIKITSLDANSSAGKRAGFILVDELWLLGQIAKAPGALQEATGGLVSRPHGWVLCLTTQSDAPPTGVFRQKLLYARQVADGTIDDPTYLPVLFEPGPKAKKPHTVEQMLKLAKSTNPNLGASVSESWLVAEFKRTKDTQDGSYQRFLAKHLNMEIGQSMRADRWTGADHWMPAEDDTLDLDSLIERSEVLTIGLDVGGSDDLTALYVIGRTPDGRKLGWGHAWLAEHAAHLGGRETERYKDLAAAGELTIVPTVGDDIYAVAQVCARLHRTGKVHEVGADGFGLPGLRAALISAGIPDDIIVPIKQGGWLTSAIQTAERWLAGGNFAVATQELMRWTVSNCKLETTGNNVRITKQAAGSAKIDPVAALLNATALMMSEPPAQKKKILIFGLS